MNELYELMILIIVLVLVVGIPLLILTQNPSKNVKIYQGVLMGMTVALGLIIFNVLGHYTDQTRTNDAAEAETSIHSYGLIK